MNEKWLWVVVVVGVLGAAAYGLLSFPTGYMWKGTPVWCGFLRDTELTDVSICTLLTFPDSAVLVHAYQHGGQDIFRFYTVKMSRIDIKEFIDQEPDNNKWYISRYEGQEANEMAQDWLDRNLYVGLPEELWEGRFPTGEECYALHLQSVDEKDPWVLVYICSDDSDFSDVYILLVL